MSPIWTNILFCEELTSSLEDKLPFYQQESYVNLGAQGLDSFNYHGFWKWKGNHSPYNTDNAFQTTVHGDLLLDLIVSAKDERSHVQAFVFGFISHYLLSRIIHPYIDYKVKEEGFNKQKLEATIDTLMMDKFRHLKTWRAPVCKEIDVGLKLDTSLLELLQKKINHYYPALTLQTETDYIQKAYQDMKWTYRILYDPYGWKNILFAKSFSLHFYKPVNDHYDYLNTEKKPWHPICTKETSTKSFLELYEDARSLGLETMGEVLSFWSCPAKSSLIKLRELLCSETEWIGNPA